MSIVNPKQANCPYCGKSNIDCCCVCGACSDHSHVNCNNSRLGMIDASVGTCNCCGRANVLICSDEQCCGIHAHAHM